MDRLTNDTCIECVWVVMSLKLAVSSFSSPIKILKCSFSTISVYFYSRVTVKVCYAAYYVAHVVISHHAVQYNP